MPDRNLRDWYWLADDGRVFGSRAGAVIAKDEAGYAAFVEAGRAATVWPRDETGAQTDAALDEVLRLYGLSTKGVVRSATSYDLVSALTDDEVAALGKAKPKDQHLFGKRADAFPEDNPKVARIAALLGTTPKAWFDRALAPAS